MVGRDLKNSKKIVRGENGARTPYDPLVDTQPSALTCRIQFRRKQAIYTHVHCTEANKQS